MALRIYNTMSRRKDDFTSLSPGKVGMYVCGMTVYDLCHIGHARSQVVFDTIARYLRHKGYELTYVCNFTDVDDKIIDRARETGRDPRELAQCNIRDFHRDMDALAVARPDREPKATEHIPQIIETIRRLMDRGYAYAKGGDVFYSTRKFVPYGKLSGRKLDDMIAGERVEVDPRKKDPMDFVLWKAAKPGEPSWESPWGTGRPGWHIECSAMAEHHLGTPFDIHGGGKDLIFPHHENEIAQSEAATGREFVRYWMHNGLVQFNQEKMAKSTGNFRTICDILKRYSPEALRFFLLSAHYRSPMEFSEQSLIEAETALEKLYAAYQILLSKQGSPGDDAAMTKEQKELLEKVRKAAADFQEAMDDDFNTAKAGGHLFEIAHLAQDAAESEGEAGREALLAHIKTEFCAANDILGFLIAEPGAYASARTERRLRHLGMSAEDIEKQIDERAQARAARDFAASDAIRDRLMEKGILLHDSPEGTSWSIK